MIFFQVTAFTDTDDSFHKGYFIYYFGQSVFFLHFTHTQRERERLTNVMLALQDMFAKLCPGQMLEKLTVWTSSCLTCKTL